MKTLTSSSIVFAILLFSATVSLAQCPADSLNMTKLYQYDASTQSSASGVFYSDVWGYVDPEGREYGIIGSADSILIFDVTNPDSIYKVEARPGTSAEIWRDLKTYDEYLYAVCDGCSEGLRIFDLSHLPDSFPQVNQITSDFGNAHNIYIETDSARLYVVGSGGAPEGMLIYDLNSTPNDPPLLKKLSLDTIQGEPAGVNYYIHDIFVKGDTAYCSHGNAGYILWDTSDPDSIYRVSTPLPLESTDLRSYVHSSWNSVDDNYAYVATEIGNRQIYIVDQSDKSNPVLDTTWREPLLECNGFTNNIPHNPYVVGNTLYISYYQDGVNILDISEPRLPIRTGYYDLDPTNNSYSGTTSNWGVYPFLPSGTIIASDTKFGFFVLEYTPPIVPLELISFEAKTLRNSTDALLEWQVADAINVSHFELQSSSNGVDFRDIAVLAYEPNKSTYDYIDTSVKSANKYYRLKIIDVDRQYDYSDIRQLKFKNSIAVALYPTVTSDFATIEASTSESLSVQVFNMSGQLVLNQMVKNGDQLNLGSLFPGLYTAVIQVGETLFQTKLVVN